MNTGRPGAFPVWRAPVEEYPELLVGRSSRFVGGVRALRLLVLGGWLGVTLLAFIGPGLSTPYLLAYPVLLVFSAWALGVGYGITLFVLRRLAGRQQQGGSDAGAMDQKSTVAHGKSSVAGKERAAVGAPPGGVYSLSRQRRR